MRGTLFTSFLFALHALHAEIVTFNSGNYSDIAAGYHFVGTDAMARDPGAVTVQSLGSLPETEAFWGHLAERISGWMARCGVTEADRVKVRQGWLEPLMAEARRWESWLGIFEARPGGSSDWCLAIRLPGSRAAIWQDHLRLFVSDATGIGSRSVFVGGNRGWEIARAGSEYGWRCVRVGDWLLLSGAAPGFDRMTEVIDRVRQTGRPVTKADDYWMQAKADLGHWPTLKNESKLGLRLLSRGAKIRTELDVELPEAWAPAAGEWLIPTNMIRDPLISFTSIRGMRTLTERFKLLESTGISAEIDQAFFWAMPDAPFLSFVAVPVDHATNVLRQVAPKIVEKLAGVIEGKGAGEVSWNPESTELMWKGLPLIIPYLRAGEKKLVAGGLFATIAAGDPPPADLIDQVMGRENLVYYDWEITETRLKQWTQLFQFLSMLSSDNWFALTSPPMKWMVLAGPLLGNSVTEITRESPRHLRLVRQSYTGLTGFEIITLTAWLHDPGFPEFRWPFEPFGKRPLPAGVTEPTAPPGPTKPKASKRKTQAP